MLCPSHCALAGMAESTWQRSRAEPGVVKMNQHIWQCTPPPPPPMMWSCRPEAAAAVAPPTPRAQSYSNPSFFPSSLLPWLPSPPQAAPEPTIRNHDRQEGGDQERGHVRGHAAGRGGLRHPGYGEVQHREGHRSLHQEGERQVCADVMATWCYSNSLPPPSFFDSSDLYLARSESFQSSWSTCFSWGVLLCVPACVCCIVN